MLKERLEGTRKELQEQESARDQLQVQLQLVTEELQATKAKRNKDMSKIDEVSDSCYRYQLRVCLIIGYNSVYYCSLIIICLILFTVAP